MTFWLRIIVYTISISSVTANDVTEDIFIEMSDLHELCPYSSFCRRNATSEFQYSSTSYPCCHSCSCSSDCGLRGDCCFSKHGGNTEPIDDVICRHSFRIDPFKYFKYRRIAQSATYYKMVDKCHCLNDNRNITGSTCEQSDQNFVFAPVYSKSTGKIYSNVGYAECNNDLQTIAWQRSIVCPPNVEPSMPELMNVTDVQQDVSSGGHGCLLYYIPPKHLNLDEAICFPNTIRKCNITRMMKTREPFWDFCEKFNATFTVQTFSDLKAYGNVYCFMCNTDISISNIKEMQCPKRSSGQGKEFEHASLTIILDYDVNRDLPYSNHGRQEGQVCPNGTVYISSFKVSFSLQNYY